MASVLLAIDQGTTGTTVALVSEKAELLGKVNIEYEQLYPKPSWVEHDPEKIWASVVQGIERVLRDTHHTPEAVAAIGITNQRETVVLWERKTGRPVHNAIVWQDRRTAKACEALKRKNLKQMIQKKTGLVIDPYFSASKIQWLLQNVPRAKKRDLCVGTIDSFLLARLTGGKVHKTEISNASRTQLLNIHTGRWDKDLLRLFHVPPAILPEVGPSSGVLGHTHGMAGLPDGVPIAGIAGDQQAALFGQACFATGEAKCTFGTGSFLLLNTGNKPATSKAGLLTTIAWQLQHDKYPTYALEGGAFICGAAVQFLRDQLKFIAKSSEVETLASTVGDAAGVEFVPALTGLGAPYWDAEARGVICGLTRGSTAAHIARATLEAMALQNVEILLAMEKDLKRRLKGLRVDGGAAANNLLMQLQADYLGAELTRPKIIETTVAGAAFLAGLGVGIWKDRQEILKTWQSERVFKPQLGRSARLGRLDRFRRAVARAR